MLKLSIVGAAVAGVVMTAMAPSAGALPTPNSISATNDLLHEVAHRGGGGGGGGGHAHGGPRGPGGHGGGGPRGGHGIGGGGPRGGHHAHGPSGHGPRHYGGPRYRGGLYLPYYGSYGYGAYSYYYDDDYAECSWLRRRAVATGKRYWWNRYRACIED